eukprot:c48130_g1_i1 orf=1-156(-)
MNLRYVTFPHISKSIVPNDIKSIKLHLYVLLPPWQHTQGHIIAIGYVSFYHN